MMDALVNVRTGAVTEAARDDGESRFRGSDAIGFVEEQIVAWGAADTLARCSTLVGRDAEL